MRGPPRNRHRCLLSGATSGSQRESVHDSRSTANIRMPLEWDAVNERTYRQLSHSKYQNAS